ncbi:MAG: AraC family transcriptional regulator [Cyanobacteriota bacterium]
MMSNAPAKVSVKAWESEGILLERYFYTSGAVEPLPKHSHNEYQFGLSFDCQGEYYYRGARHQTPIGSLSIIHSGEVHAPSQRTYLPNPATFWMMHADPGWLQTAASEITTKTATLPFFPTPFLCDRKLAQLFLQFHIAVENESSNLEQDSFLLHLFTHLIANYAQNRPSLSPLRSVRPAVMRVRDFLHAHYTLNVSLEELANVAQLSRFHLCRSFRQEIGVSPHAYQTQVRIAHAKRLLARGMAIAQVASDTGFCDQSHLGGHFKRLVGVTPGNYLSKRNNVLDIPE